jgi:hypothetical protein
MIPCPVCGRPMSTTLQGGRPRTYCSKGCAQTGKARLRNADVDEMAVDRLIHGEPVHSTRAERTKASAILTSAGHSAAHIAILLRISKRSVVRFRRVVNA